LFTLYVLPFLVVALALLYGFCRAQHPESESLREELEQLQATIRQRTMILAPEGNIDATSLPEEIRESKNSNHFEVICNDGEPGGDFLVSLRELEEDYIRKVLAATGNNKTQAAKILGIHSTSLLRRLKKEPVPN